MGLTPFALAELGLQLADWPRPRFTQDPYVSFDGHERLFRLDESQDKYITSPIRFPYFYPDSFSRVKPKQTTRIFCLGGSTVQGRPYSIETSFTTWLRLTLESAQPERQWEVVNCGGISYASYRLRYVAREVLDYEPDLIIVYTGHNEFLERRSFDVVKNSPRLTNVTQQTIRRSKLVSLAATIWETATGVSHDSINVDEPGGDARRTRLKQEVDALLDYRGGLEEYHRGELQHDLVTDHFRHSLTAIASAARGQQIPVVFCHPACNLKDCPPFKVETDPSLSAEQQSRFSQLWTESRHYVAKDAGQQISLLKRALQIDQGHAGALYQLAKCYELQDDHDLALQAFIAAKDADVCPLRIIEPMQDVIDEVARQWGITVVDLRPVFAARAQQTIPGDECFLDHVHPTIDGHQWIADQLFQAMIDLDLVQLSNDQWLEARQQRYHAHMQSLETSYFSRGQERLEGLRRWATGRAEKLRSDPVNEPPAVQEQVTD